MPWGLRETLFGLVVALLPDVLPSVLILLPGLAASVAPTTYTSVAAIGGTVVYDGWWIVWAWFFSLRKFRLKLSAWGFRRPSLSIVWIVPLVVVASDGMELLYSHWVRVPAEGVASKFPHSDIGLALFAIGACVLAPFFEEVFFRGFLFQGFSSWRGPLVAAILSSALWSVGHRSVALFVPIFVVGLLMCWAFRRTGSLWTTIAIHVAMNTLAVLSWSSLAGR